MSAKDGMIRGRLIGGPLDGMPIEEWCGTQTVLVNSELDAPDAARGAAYYLYRRCEPDKFTSEGLTEFHYFAGGVGGLSE